MVLVLPFRAVRPDRRFAVQVAALPYDVMTREEGKVAVSDNPLSFMHVEKSEIDVPDSTPGNDALIYQTAKNNFHKLQEDGILLQEEAPCFYVYRQQMGTQVQTGIVAVVSSREYDEGKIKKHELTRQDKEEDRINHVNTVDAQTGPVFLTYPSSSRINSLVAKIVVAEPEYNFTAEDGVIHTSWIVNDVKQIEEIKKEFQAINALYIADGHHRAAAASAVAKMRRQKENPQALQEYEKVLAVLFPHDQLKVMDYNRAVKDLNGFTPQKFKEKIGSRFLITEDFPEKAPQRFHDFGMYLQGKWYKLTVRDGAFDDRDAVARLDAAILQEHLLGPVLGINDPRTDERIKFIGGIRGMAELEKLVDKGGYAVAFSLYPTSIEQVMQVADAGAIMPPKSTWFEPKLRSGLFVHKLS